MNANVRFEIIAHAFQKDTGLMAPGKSVPDCMYQDEGERWRMWEKWNRHHRNIIDNLLSSVEYVMQVTQMEEDLEMEKKEVARLRARLSDIEPPLVDKK